jgi:hypothetical protein
MLVSPDHRVHLSNRFSVSAVPELEAVFVGAAAEHPARAAAGDALAAAAGLGFTPAAGDGSLTRLPLAFASASSFAASFPGDESWLAQAVRDYFNAGGLRAWVVRVAVDPAAPVDAYMAPSLSIGTIQPQHGVEIALRVPSAGLLVLPDLEYLCLATTLPPPAPPAATPQPPGFRPVADFVAPPRPVVPPTPPNTTAVSPHEVLRRVSAALATAPRPDMLCLFALPVGADQTLTASGLVKRADTYLRGGSGGDLPQVQVFAPLLRDPAGGIATPSGMIAGVLAATAQTDGVWRSIAGRPLPLGITPLRPIESSALADLRRNGIAALRFGPGGTVLDDDILALTDTPANVVRRAAGTRRLVGWLLRNLKRFGEQVAFENVLDDGRVELILTDLFKALQRRGALNGNRVSDAVRITRRKENTALIFEIAVDIATALETIRLRFLDGELSASLGNAV